MARELMGSYRNLYTTGEVTTIAAETATAGHLLALRNKPGGKNNVLVVLRALEVEFFLGTAFSSAQEVGFSAKLLRAYRAAHTGGTAITAGGGQRKGAQPTATFSGSIASTSALTAGTQTIEQNPIARGSFYASAIGAVMTPRRYDFGPEGFELRTEEGLLVTNYVVMGATGAGHWHFTPEWDEYLLT